MLSHLICIGILALVVFQFLQITDNQLRLSFLDIGQGDSILIQTPEHQNILIDAGEGSQVIGELGKQMGFFDKTINLFILTHPHRDHFGGLLEILQKYSVKQIMLTGVISNDQAKIMAMGKPRINRNATPEWNQSGKRRAGTKVSDTCNNNQATTK